ncbi:MAG: cytochrome c biogenesis protein CcsA, partial [Bacteroidota bacterium]
ALVQVFLASMILGIYFFDYKLGSNPFLLMKEHPDYSHLPFVLKAKYESTARGLNPLLMNYWMTIHPPTLFLGFASTLIPFAFAIAALWNKKYTAWQSLALPWAYFGVLVLGIGILMGGAWAYEALSFGGFWAWDPVENSSLVPWLVLVAAAHTMIINKNKGGSLFTTHMLAIGSFLLVLYSTFLTRSGVLGNASVHAFTDLGMTGQLVVYVLTFMFITVALLIHNELFKVSYVILSLMMILAAGVYGYSKVLLLIWLGASFIITIVSYLLYFPKQKEEEALFSREFWMFLGSLVLILSSLIITYFTSIPVINKLFNTEYAPPKVPVYNQWVIPFAIIMMFLMAAAQFLKYKKTNAKQFLKRMLWPMLLALVFSVVCCIPLYFINQNNSVFSTWDLISFALLFFTALYAVLGNADYWLLILKGKISKGGASIAHIGFALVILGALVSTSKKVTLSKNTGQRKVSGLGSDFDDSRSILLTQGDTLAMGNYFVTYTGKRKDGIDVYFKVDYFLENAAKKKEFIFSLEPRVQDNPRMGRAPEPDTKHYLNRDVYTHVTYADLSMDTIKKDLKAFGTAKNFIGHVGDTIFASNALVVIDSLRTNISEWEYEKNDSLLEVTAVLKCVDEKSNIYRAYPKFLIKKSVVIPIEAVVEELGLKLVFWKINPVEGNIEITLSERLSNQRDFIVMEAYVFPYINVLWLGCLIMGFGSFIAIRERMRILKLKS